LPAVMAGFAKPKTPVTLGVAKTRAVFVPAPAKLPPMRISTGVRGKTRCIAAKSPPATVAQRWTPKTVKAAAAPKPNVTITRTALTRFNVNGRLRLTALVASVPVPTWPSSGSTVSRWVGLFAKTPNPVARPAPAQLAGRIAASIMPARITAPPVSKVLCVVRLPAVAAKTLMLSGAIANLPAPLPRPPDQPARQQQPLPPPPPGYQWLHQLGQSGQRPP